jgi:hypothetical protein
MGKLESNASKKTDFRTADKVVWLAGAGRVLPHEQWKRGYGPHELS